MLGLAACPESPVWLDWTGRGSEAHKARQKLLGAAAGAMDVVSVPGPDDTGSEDAMLPLTERPSDTGSMAASEQVRGHECLDPQHHLLAGG